MPLDSAPAHVLSMVNVKGGVTKTTSAINLATGLAFKGRRVLFLDLDPQSNATYTLLGILSEDEAGTLYEVLIGGQPLQSILRPTKLPTLSIAPGTLALSDADLLLSGRTGREWTLRNALEKYLATASLDYVIVDTPPNLNLLSVNSLTACTGYIVPIALTLYATLGLTLLTKTVRRLEENLRVTIPLVGALAALKDNTIESQERYNHVKAYFSDKLFQTVIPRNVRVDEANDRRILYEYAPQSTGAIAYAHFVEEVVSRVE